MKQVVVMEGWIYANFLQVAPVHVTLDDLEDLIGALSLEVIIWKPFSILDQLSHIIIIYRVPMLSLKGEFAKYFFFIKLTVV